MQRHHRAYYLCKQKKPFKIFKKSEVLSYGAYTNNNNF